MVAGEHRKRFGSAGLIRQRGRYQRTGRCEYLYEATGASQRHAECEKPFQAEYQSRICGGHRPRGIPGHQLPCRRGCYRNPRADVRRAHRQSRRRWLRCRNGPRASQSQFGPSACHSAGPIRSASHRRCGAGDRQSVWPEQDSHPGYRQCDRPRPSWPVNLRKFYSDRCCD